MSSAFSRLFGPSPDHNTIITAIALGAIGGVLLPELSTFLSYIRLHLLHRSKLSRYHHPKSISSPNPSTPDSASSIDNENHYPWALITGASDGIGLGFAQSLAARTFNIILHGRNASKLNRIIKDLRTQYPHLHFEPFICDATDRSTWSSSLSELAADLHTRNINLTILVNNIGGNPNIAKSFTPLSAYPEDELTSLIDLNVTFPVQITRTMLPLLIENKPSLIINMSSVCGFTPIPYLAGYNGGKAFIAQFSKTLRMEMVAEGHGDVEVLSVVAAKVQSGGMRSETSWSVPSSEGFARSVLGLVGCGRGEVVGWWSHGAQIWGLGVLPGWVREWLLVKIASEEKAGLEGRGKE